MGNKKGDTRSGEKALSVPLVIVMFEPFWTVYRLWILCHFCLEEWGGDVPAGVRTGS